MFIAYMIKHAGLQGYLTTIKHGPSFCVNAIYTEILNIVRVVGLIAQ